LLGGIGRGGGHGGHGRCQRGHEHPAGQPRTAPL
jgi:hypothetical protein